MRILFLTTYFRPESAANAVLMSQLAEELIALGHQVTVITSLPHYDANKIAEGYRQKLWVREQHGAIAVHRVYLYLPAKKSNLVGRLLSYLSFNVLSVVAGLLIPRHDLLFVPSPPLTNGVCAFFLSRLRGMPFVYNLQDIYPDVAVRLGILTNPRLIKAFEKLEKFVYEKAAAVSAISDSFRRNLLAKGVHESKIAVIPNFVDCDFIAPLPRSNAFSREHGLEDKFTAVFAGNVGLSQNLETLLKAAAQLAGLPDFQLMIVGNGSTRENLIEQARSMGLRNVLFLPFQPWARVPELYASADVCLIPLRHNISEGSVPSKLWTIMAAARPVVAAVDEGSDTYEAIQLADAGRCVTPEDPDGLTTALTSMYKNREGARQMGLRGRKYVEMHRARRTVALYYNALFERVVQGAPAGGRVGFSIKKVQIYISRFRRCTGLPIRD